MSDPFVGLLTFGVQLALPPGSIPRLRRVHAAEV